MKKFSWFVGGLVCAFAAVFSQETGTFFLHFNRICLKLPIFFQNTRCEWGGSTLFLLKISNQKTCDKMFLWAEIIFGCGDEPVCRGGYCWKLGIC